MLLGIHSLYHFDFKSHPYHVLDDPRLRRSRIGSCSFARHRGLLGSTEWCQHDHRKHDCRSQQARIAVPAKVVALIQAVAVGRNLDFVRRLEGPLLISQRSPSVIVCITSHTTSITEQPSADDCWWLTSGHEISSPVTSVVQGSSPLRGTASASEPPFSGHEG